jgi:amino acid transporter
LSTVQLQQPRPAHAPALTWWLAAGLVGADIGTSVFYSTGILYPLVGGAAPFFITFVCLAMWLFKLTYQEGCAVSPLNGGAYTMVLQTIGRRTALIVGSMTILSYLATAVVSALSGAKYLSTLPVFGDTVWSNWQIALVAAVPIVGFAILNVFGLRESTKLTFAIAAFHFVTLIGMDVYGLFLAFTQGAHWERLTEGFGALAPHALVMAFAAAFLGITGFESAAQIIEEIAEPRWLSIRRIYTTIVILVSFTGPISSLLCIVLLSDADIVKYKDAFLSGVAVLEGGTPMLYLLVTNACLTLFAAVNTAFAGATGLITTMGKQGNLPALVLQRWSEWRPALQGYPLSVLPFMALCVVMLIAFPGSVDRLGEVYGIAFLGVMIFYCAGVLLLRLHQPVKIARAPYINTWTFKIRHVTLPWAPLLGAILLIVAQGVLIITAHEARGLGMQLFLAVLLLMAFYRLGQVETRMVQLPDLRLGLGRYRKMENLPDLPTYVVCTSGSNATRLVTEISYLLKKFGENIEILLFHAEEQSAGPARLSEGLERLISQQIEEFYDSRDFILSLKVLPGSLLEVLPEYGKSRRLNTIFITTGRDAVLSENLRVQLSSEIGVEVVRLDDDTLPKGPGVWFDQWSQGFRQRDQAWARSESGSESRQDADGYSDV